MDSPHTGEVAIEIDGRPHTLVFDWRALSAARALFGGRDLGLVLADGDPVATAGLLACGLARHHPEMTADRILDASPPLVPAAAAIGRALGYAYWGPGGRPAEDPPAPAPATPAAGIWSGPR